MGNYINQLVAAWLTWVSYRTGNDENEVIKSYQYVLDKLNK